MLVAVALLPLLVAQADHRVIMHSGPLDALGITLANTYNASFVAVNDANQVAAVVGVNGNGTCTTGGAVIVEDHGVYAMPLCTGMMIDGKSITQIVPQALSLNTGILGDDGVIATPVYLDFQTTAIVRVVGGVIETLAVEDELDENSDAFVFDGEEMVVSDNGGVGFTAGYGQRTYWAPLGATRAYRCGTGAGYALIASETALWFGEGTELARCQIINDAAVVDYPFPGGAGLPGGAGTVDLAPLPMGGGRGGIGIEAFTVDGQWSWSVDDQGAATLRGQPPANATDPYPSIAAISPDGTHTIVMQDIAGYGEPATYEENGSVVFDNDVSPPGAGDESSRIPENYAWFSVADDGTVWLLGGLATALTEFATRYAMYRSLPAAPIQRMLANGDTVTIDGVDQVVTAVNTENFDNGDSYDHIGAVANATGAAVASVTYLENGSQPRFAVLLLGEPEVPDLVPYADIRVDGTIVDDVPVEELFDLEIGVGNAGIGTAQASLLVSFTPNIAYNGTDPAGCTIARAGATISSMTCAASAFGDLATNGSAYVTLADAYYPEGSPVPGTLVLGLEATQTSGTPEFATANSAKDVEIPIRFSDAHLNILVTYTADPDGRLHASMNVLNEGPETARGIVVTLPGVPVPSTLPTDCSGSSAVECQIDEIGAGSSKSFTFDFGILSPNDVAAPFEPEAFMSSNDPSGPTVNVIGDPEDLLKTDLVLVVGAPTSAGSFHDSGSVVVLTIKNTSGRNATGVKVTLTGVGDGSCPGNMGGGGGLVCDVPPVPAGGSVDVSVMIITYSAATGVDATVRQNEVDKNPEDNVGPVGVSGTSHGEDPSDPTDSPWCAAQSTHGGAPLSAAAPLALLVVVAVRRRRR